MRSLLLLALGLVLAGCARREGYGTRLPAVIEETYYQVPLGSPGKKFAALPPLVKDTIRSQIGTAEIANIERFRGKYQPFYRLTFVRQLTDPPLYVGENGEVLNPDLTVAVGAPGDEFWVSAGEEAGALSVADLPAAVWRSLEERTSAGTVEKVEKQTWGNRLVYNIQSRAEGKITELRIAEDGTILQGP